MFGAAVDDFGGIACGVGVVEVGQDVPARRLSVLPSVMSSVMPLGTRLEVSVLISASLMALPVRVLGAR